MKSIACSAWPAPTPWLTACTHMSIQMRAIALGLSRACLAAVLAACGVTSSDGSVGAAGGDTKQQPEIGQLAFIVWTCADLECLNLESSETTAHTYTACSALLDEAQSVGLGICESQRKGASVVSTPARCTPLGTQCPSARLAYNWDDTRKQRVDDSEVGVDAGVPASDAGVP